MTEDFEKTLTGRITCAIITAVLAFIYAFIWYWALGGFTCTP